MKKLLAAFLLFVPVVSFATKKPAANEFERQAGLFAAGSKASETDMTGLRLGKTCSQKAQNRYFESVLTTKKTDKNLLAVVYFNAQGADCEDYVQAALITCLTDQGDYIFTDAKPVDFGKKKTEFESVYKGAPCKNEVRMSGQYVFVRTACASDNSIFDEDVWYSYFYKKF